MPEPNVNYANYEHTHTRALSQRIGPTKSEKFIYELFARWNIFLVNRVSLSLRSAVTPRDPTCLPLSPSRANSHKSIDFSISSDFSSCTC